MNAFNLQRFGRLARWTLTNDKAFYRKMFLQPLTILTLLFLAFTTHFFSASENGVSQSYRICSIAVEIMFAVLVMTGSGYMFVSMKGKHDRQALLMLPASNLEKYLMRYATWILLLPIYIAAFLIADGVQYFVGWLLNHKELMLVSSYIIDDIEYIANDMRWISNGQLSTLGENVETITSLLWIHSIYALGANFFRSSKYSWLLTTAVLILMGTMLVWLLTDSNVKEPTLTGDNYADIIVFALLTFVNFWLAFRLFCRQQVIGKFVNI